MAEFCGSKTILFGYVCFASKSPFKRLASMSLMHLMCRLFSGHCEPPKPVTNDKAADLGQREAKTEAMSEEQLRHMEGGPAAESAQQEKMSQ